ncbi:MAG TPA: glycosyltransferase family 29 protein [Verrucomicrobiae bacterium]|nr:glycosyltransferase family 29 protein [Verrucomicrobiae bacterium]
MNPAILYSEDLVSALRGRIAIIGNATPRWELGALIDQYDAVIRMNNYRTEGFQKLVGAKTTHRCTTGWKDVENRNLHPEFSPFTLEANESGNLPVYNAANNLPLLTARHDVHSNIPELKRPSTGLALVQLCVDQKLSVDLFAFDGFKTPHYWEPEKGIYTSHSLSEMDVILSRPGVLLYGETTPSEMIPVFRRADDAERYDAGVRSLIRWLSSQPPARQILVYGAGDTTMVSRLEELGHEVTAVTPHRAAFEQLKCHNKMHGSPLALALLSGHFDLFIALHSLESLTSNDRKLALREAARTCSSAFITVSAQARSHVLQSQADWMNEIRSAGFDAQPQAAQNENQDVFVATQHLTVLPEPPQAVRANAKSYAEPEQLREELKRACEENNRLRTQITDLNEEWQELLDEARQGKSSNRGKKNVIRGSSFLSVEPSPASPTVPGLEQAEAAARQALALEPTGIAALRLLASVTAQQGKWIDTRDALIGLLSQTPDDVEMLLLSARCQFELGDPVTSRKLFHQVLSLCPDNPIARENLVALDALESRASELEKLLTTGQRLIKAGNIPEAIVLLEQAAQIAPDDVDLLVGLAGLQAQQQRVDDARRTLTRALTVKPGHPVASRLLLSLTLDGEALKTDGAPAASPAVESQVQQRIPSGPETKEARPSGHLENHDVKRLLARTPHMNLEQANRMTSFMTEHRVEKVLELGFAHGVSTCYMAAALARNGGGSIVTIDVASARQRQPNIEELLERIGERERVTVHYEPTSYTWRLMKFLEENPRPVFDLCYIDGAHNWFVDGFAFFLVNLLVKPGGWIIFDDYNWTYASSPGYANSEFVRKMPEDEKTTPQVKKVFELLVKTHPDYQSFHVVGGWGFAQKKPLAVLRNGATTERTAEGTPHSSARGQAANQTAFQALHQGFELLKERRFFDAQAAVRDYHAQINYDELPRTDNRTEQNPKVSVIIVAYKINQGLIQCLDSLAASENPPHEIIVVDNGGNEAIADELARRPILHLRVGFNVILAEGRNIGVHFARSPIASFVDDDAIAAKGYLASVVEAFETFDVQAFRGKVLPKSDHPHNSRARHYNMGDLAFPADIDTEGNSAFRIDTWRALGGQDPLLFGGEGVELSYRMAKQHGDLCVMYWPFTIIYHDYAVTDNKLETKQSRHVLMREYSVFKHADLYQFHNRLVAFALSPEAKAEGNRLLRRRIAQPFAPAQPKSAGQANQPLITICVPTYNRAAYIEQTIQSALRQKYGNFEVVVVDDGSTDNTVEVMSRITDPRVRFIQKEHSGGPHTRNRCIAEARGELLVWLDSDDVILPHTLATYAETLTANPDADVVYGNLQVADANLNVSDLWIYRDYHGWRDALVSDLIVENRIPNVCTLVRKSCYAMVGGYNPDFPRAHDYEFWTRLAPGHVFKSVNMEVGIYRRHEQSLSKLSARPDTSYEAKAVKAMLERHDLRTLFPFCYSVNAVSARGDARAWLMAAWILTNYGDMRSAAQCAQRSVKAADLGLNTRLLPLLQTTAGLPASPSRGNDKLATILENGRRAWAAGNPLKAIEACEQLNEEYPETPESLLLTAVSLDRWGNPNDARTGFRCLVRRQCDASFCQSTLESESARESAPETSLSDSARLACKLSAFFPEAIPAAAVEATLAFIQRASEAEDSAAFLKANRSGSTPLFFALISLNADELSQPALRMQFAKVRASLQNVNASASRQRAEGYSFCIITGGERREKLVRQIESIRKLGLPNYEILVGGDISNVPDGVHKVDLLDAARAGRLGKMRNELGRRAQFNHLVVSDDDIIFDETFGLGLQRFGEGYDVMAVRICNADGTRFWDWASTGTFKGSVLLDYWDSDPGVYITGGMCVLKTSVLDRVKWDDSRGFYQAEDVDFTARLKAAGFSIAFNTFCTVLHDDDRYSRVDRRIFRFDHLITGVSEQIKLKKRDEARRWIREAVRMAGNYTDRLAAVKEVAATLNDSEVVTQVTQKLASSAPQNDSAKSRNAAGIQVDWVGTFFDHGSLSHVNREFTKQLAAQAGVQLARVQSDQMDPTSLPINRRNLAKDVSLKLSADAAITVRHAWPPTWNRPKHGKFVVIQPWEFGSLPKDWVEQSRKVDEFWAYTNYVRQCYIDSGVDAAKVKVVPLGVDGERFHPNAAPRPLATQKKFKFLFVGGTIGRKGIDVLMNAYLASFSAADDVCLVIKDFGGQSVYKGQTFADKIRAVQQRPNAPEMLYLDCEMAPEELPGLYTACDCLVHPYRGEGFGLPVLEAMACALPVIVTAGGSTDDFATDDVAYRIPAKRLEIGNDVSGLKTVSTAWLLEPDVKVVAERMRWVAHNPDAARARGRAANEHVRRNWTWTNAAKVAAERLLALQPLPVTMATEVAAKASSLPPSASIGSLSAAKEAFAAAMLENAWNLALAAIAKRPCNPEALLLLAEIALAVGDGTTARKLAQHARELVPGYKAAKQFLTKPLKGNSKPSWLVLPEELSNRKSQIADRLTVCVVTRNEEKFIEQCLKSITPIAHQIVVVDTGSTDRTVELAKSLGAEVHHFTWCDDFSAARNAALEHARGDWILMLDADEELPADQHAKLLRDLAKKDVIAYRMPLTNIGKDDGRSFVPRLFRNVPGTWFYGRIHEQVFPSLIPMCKQWGMKTELGTAELLHHGYTKEMIRDRNKIERNLRLLQLAVEEMPNDINLVMNLGLELMRSDKLDEGIEKYQQAFDLMSAQQQSDIVPELREVLLTQFASHLCKAKRFADVTSMLDSRLAGAGAGGLTATLHYASALAHYELKQYQDAATHLRKCIEKRNQPALSPINVDIRTAAPAHMLARCLSELGDATHAEKAFQMALAEQGKTELIQLDYARFLAKQQRPVDALHKLHEIVTKNPQNIAAWKFGAEIALGHPEFLEFACDWTSEAMRALPAESSVIGHRAEALLLNQQTSDAHPLWEKACNCNRPPEALAALILCSAVESQPVPPTRDAAEELATSRAFVGWYQKLINANAEQTIERLNSRIEELRGSLPTAAGLLDSAITAANT